MLSEPGEIATRTHPVTTSSDVGTFIDEIRRRLTAPGTAFEVIDEDVRGHTMPVFRHRARSARALLEASDRFGERSYLVDGSVRLTFRQHAELVEGFAAHLQCALGVREGDRVAIHSANRWEWVVADRATLSIGALPVAFNGWWTSEETAHATGLVEPAVILGDATRLEIVALAGYAGPVIDLGELRAIAIRRRDEQVAIPDFDEDAPAELVFTSGTTGRPKAAVIPHRTIVGFAQLNLINDAMARVAMGGEPPAQGEDLPPTDDIVLVTSPLFHVSMLHGVVVQAMVTGSSFVLLPGRFDPERVLATIEGEKVTRWLALGSAGARVAASPAIGTYDTSSLRQVGVGGAPVSPSVQEALRVAFPSAKEALGMGYTSTEAGAVVAGIGGPEYLLHPTATGRVTFTTQVELRDPDGNQVAEGQAGRVHVRSPYTMVGYFNAPDATRQVLDEGWLDLGDIGRFDHDLLYIDTRARDMILVSAENVSPTEVEFRLDAHPAIREVAVLAVDDPVTGDAVGAVISLEPGSHTSIDALETWCRAELAGYKVPTRWYVHDEPLPRTASGKVIKDELRVLIDEGSLPLEAC